MKSAKLRYKSPAIKDVVDQLEIQLGCDAFVLADHWENDPFAVGIASTYDLRVLMYISIYGEAGGRYGYEMESPSTEVNTSEYFVTGRGSGLTLDELVVVVNDHIIRT